jgi:hypothetical protein
MGIIKNVQTDVDLDGSLASAETAEAFLFRDAAAGAQITETGAFSFSDALAATGAGAQVTADGAFSFSDSLAARNFFEGFDDYSL